MEVTLNLPDDVAMRAQDAGLLTVDSVRQLLEDAMRRAAGRKLMAMTEKLHAAGIEPMSEEALDDLIHEVRAERRMANAGRS